MMHVKVEKLRMQRELEDRQEQQALHYEDRITELQSVIAELRKKIDLRHVNMILYVKFFFTKLIFKLNSALIVVAYCTQCLAYWDIGILCPVIRSPQL